MSITQSAILHVIKLALVVINTQAKYCQRKIPNDCNPNERFECQIITLQFIVYKRRLSELNYGHIGLPFLSQKHHMSIICNDSSNYSK